MGQRPKIGLVLGGGGAKGAATIGVLKVIEESGVKIDYIAGTSIGAVIGGLYAAGFSLADIERYLFSQSKLDALDINYIESELRRMVRRSGCELMENTHIPFRCVAVDGDHMKEYVLSEGKLYKAILASMSIPVVYPFVQWGRVALYDGGLLNNLPVDVAKAMGADIVIAVDLQQNEDDGLQIPPLGFGGVFDTLADWSVTHPEKKKYRQNVKAADIYIHPSLPGYTASSFGRSNCEDMKKRGEAEARKHWNEIIRLKAK
jgi:NTE family protein